MFAGKERVYVLPSGFKVAEAGRSGATTEVSSI